MLVRGETRRGCGELHGRECSGNESRKSREAPLISLGGFVTYSRFGKAQRCSVSPRERHPVSETSAKRWPRRARERLVSTWGISITGEAGPESATDVPVGTVFIGDRRSGRRPR